MAQRSPEIQQDILLRRIREYLLQLSEGDRKMFIMRHYQGRSTAEISRSLNIPSHQVHLSLDNSSRHMFRHLRSLRQKLFF